MLHRSWPITFTSTSVLYLEVLPKITLCMFRIGELRSQNIVCAQLFSIAHTKVSKLSIMSLPKAAGHLDGRPAFARVIAIITGNRIALLVPLPINTPRTVYLPQTCKPWSPNSGDHLGSVGLVQVTLNPTSNPASIFPLTTCCKPSCIASDKLTMLSSYLPMM